MSPVVAARPGQTTSPVAGSCDCNDPPSPAVHRPAMKWLEIVANAYLHHMVRNIVGTLMALQGVSEIIKRVAALENHYRLQYQYEKPLQ